MKQDVLLPIRHSAQHVLMQAMQNLYGAEKVVMAMGPATEDGFYFDFRPINLKISEDDFPNIEQKMQEIIDENLPIEREEISASEAEALFSDNPFKLELIKEIEADGQLVSTYKTGSEFVDLCSGPHIPSTGKIGAFKLL